MDDTASLGLFVFFRQDLLLQNFVAHIGAFASLTPSPFNICSNAHLAIFVFPDGCKFTLDVS